MAHKVMRTLLLISIIISTAGASILQARCTRADRKHVDCNTVRCTYKKNDIIDAIRKYPKRYKSKNNCFYCGCPINEHSEK